MNINTLEVSVRLTLFHCSTNATLWRQFMHDSRRVFHNGGEGKHCAQANNQILKQIFINFF